MSARVLVVDDVLPNRRLLEAKLGGEYYEVITASNGAEALALVRDQSPDIILLDVIMPDMDGFQVCRAIRADNSTMHIPVIMVTALSNTSDRLRGLEAGADDFLSRPVNDIALFARVRSLLRMKLAMDDWRQQSITREKLGLTDQPLQLSDSAFEDARIVVVDDCPSDLDHMVEALSQDYEHVLRASRISDGLALAQGPDVDLIIISLTLESEDGLRLCSQIRSSERTRQLPVLLLGDDQDLDRIAKGLELGANDYATRPVDRSELMCRVRTQIRRYRYQQRLRQRYEESLSLALTDGLTGARNRRYATVHLPRLLAEAQNSGDSLAVLMIDLDHFKSINDKFGHVVGDEVLCEVTRRLQNRLPGNGILARMGGEEFLASLSVNNRSEAIEMAESLRQVVEATAFGPFGEAGHLSVTTSIGLGISQPAEGLEALMRRADTALYQAKRAGRNCVIVAGP